MDLLEAGDEQVVVRAGSVTWRPRAAIVAAGPWSGPFLAGAGVDVPLAVSSQTVTYFELGSATSAPPAVIDYDGDEPFVLWDPAGGLKAALHARGPLTDPDQPTPRQSPGAVDRHHGVPPYRETLAYVGRVLRKYEKQTASAKAAKPSGD